MLSLAVTAASALTPLGDTAEQTCTSVRAGIKGFSEHSFYLPLAAEEGAIGEDPLIVAQAPGIDPKSPAEERLLDLLSPVLKDLVARAGKTSAQSELPLLLALPEIDAVTEKWALGKAWMDDLSARTGLSFSMVKVNRSGRPGMLRLLSEAARVLAARAATRVIVAGVDSYLTEERLRHLDVAERVKSKRNVDGFIPGEAASALLVVPASRVEPRGAPVLGVFEDMAQADEARPFASRLQSSAAGLCGALRPLLARPAKWVSCDLNGESYRAVEWGIALARLGGVLGPVERLTHPAFFTGDIGAATSGVLASTIFTAFQRGNAPLSEALIWAASDGPNRAAARIVRAPT